MWRCINITKNNSRESQINGDIKANKVLVIGSDGSNLGVLDSKDALRKAESEGLDLVQVSPVSQKYERPPTCKIMDYGKYCYEQDKKAKEAKKKQKVIVVKEIRLSVNIGDGDFETKLRQTRSFLEQGNKVKVSIKFKGRENSDPSRGTAIMSKLADGCSDVSKIETLPKVEGRNMMMMLCPSGQQLPPKGN